MFKFAIILLKNDRHIIEAPLCLLLHILRHQFRGFGADAELPRDVHKSVVDGGGRVGAKGFGSFDSVEGFDERPH